MTTSPLPSFQTFVESTRCMHDAAQLPDRQALRQWLATTSLAPSSPSGSMSDSDAMSETEMEAMETEMQRMPRDLRALLAASLQDAPSTPTTSQEPEPEQEQPARSGRAKKKYLTELQRYEIVCRVLNGERQAHLAREYGVTRAAVCYLLKHQVDVFERVLPAHAHSAAM